ncbi:MAG: hypothetical protein Q9170_003468 [Blastenia crenularia]
MSATLGNGRVPPVPCSSSGVRRIRRIRRPQENTILVSEDFTKHQVPLPEEPQMKRRTSKGRLRGIFNRTKSGKLSTTAAEQEVEGNVLTEQKQAAPCATNETSLAQGFEDPIFDDLAPAIEVVKQQPAKSTRSKSFKKGSSASKPITWDPPPLFQAYPQSVIHGNVYAPNMYADTILRFRNEKRRKQRKNDTTSNTIKINGRDDGDTSQDDDQIGIGQMELIPKVYVLATSGYFLQYAGEGSFDRLPEKIMPIGQDSAAFASDAIPGKHWVLQVSHASDENGNPRLEKWSFTKRLGFLGESKRCSASNFLIVLESPEVLDTWLSVVRREIESWGGKRYHPDLPVRPAAGEGARILQQRPSRRFLVKRDPNQFSNTPKEPNVGWGGPEMGGTPAAGTRKHSTATQDSVHSPSTSNMTASTDQHLLDRLRSSPRMSYISTGVKTHSTSRESSPVPSLTNLKFHLEDFSVSHEHLDMADRQPIAHGPISRSSNVTRNLPGPVSSGGAPNFSVPNFSKRYSGAYSTPPLSTASSNTSNPSRKLSSPPTILEQHDNFLDVGPSTAEAVQKRESSPLGPFTGDGVDRDSLSKDSLKPTVPNPSLQAPSFDRAVPRRFSSLEYSRGISPVHVPSANTPSPHPPPTTALPALPKPNSQPLSTPARNLRRPISMQIHPSPLPVLSPNIQASLPTIPPPAAERVDLQLPPPARDPPPPPPPFVPLSSAVQYPEHYLQLSGKVLNRRSMPHLGQPPSDPPNCPLPTPPVPRLPLIKLSSGSLRRSVERPLRAGLGPRTMGLLESSES